MAQGPRPPSSPTDAQRTPFSTCSVGEVRQAPTNGGLLFLLPDSGNITAADAPAGTTRAVGEPIPAAVGHAQQMSEAGALLGAAGVETGQGYVYPSGDASWDRYCYDFYNSHGYAHSMHVCVVWLVSIAMAICLCLMSHVMNVQHGKACHMNHWQNHWVKS